MTGRATGRPPRRIRQMTRSPLSRAKLAHRRLLAPATLNGMRAARMEAAAGRRIDRAGDLALQRQQWTSLRRWLGDRGDQRLGVGVERRAEDVACRTDLHQAAEIENADAAADIVHHAE